MQSRPPGLADSVVAAAVSEGWRLPPTTAVYRSVGYGSHHWSVEDADGGRWFASVDALLEGDSEASFDRLAEALTVAVTAEESGLSFVVAPVRMPDGAVLRRLPEGYALALYPHVEGESGGFGDRLLTSDVGELTDMLCRLHSVAVRGDVGIETFAVPDRRGLEMAIGRLDDAEFWSGPYGELLRQRLAAYGDGVIRGLSEHDRLVRAAGSQTDRLVPTHGEPHPGNLIRTLDGLVLVDWNTALLAPPERDVWLLDDRTNGEASTEYAARSGRSLVPELLTRYRLAWSLADLAAFVELLRNAPERTADTAWSWDAFEETLVHLAGEPAAPATVKGDELHPAQSSLPGGGQSTAQAEQTKEHPHG